MVSWREWMGGRVRRKGVGVSWGEWVSERLGLMSERVRRTGVGVSWHGPMGKR